MIEPVEQVIHDALVHRPEDDAEHTRLRHELEAALLLVQQMTARAEQERDQMIGELRRFASAMANKLDREAVARAIRYVEDRHPSEGK